MSYDTEGIAPATVPYADHVRLVQEAMDAARELYRRAVTDPATIDAIARHVAGVLAAKCCPDCRARLTAEGA